MKTWWDSREPRERVLLAMLGALVALFALVFGLILPALDARADADRALARAQADYAVVARTAGSNTEEASARAPFDRTALLETARNAGLQITRIQTDNSGGFAVWIDGASTPALYGFFDALLGDYAAAMDRVVVSSDPNGTLSAQFTVR